MLTIHVMVPIKFPMVRFNDAWAYTKQYLYTADVAGIGFYTADDSVHRNGGQ